MFKLRPWWTSASHFSVFYNICLLKRSRHFLLAVLFFFFICPWMAPSMQNLAYNLCHCKISLSTNPTLALFISPEFFKYKLPELFAFLCISYLFAHDPDITKMFGFFSILFLFFNGISLMNQLWISICFVESQTVLVWSDYCH